MAISKGKKEKNPSSKKENPVSVPIAIMITGALIAALVYFNGAQPGNNSAKRQSDSAGKSVAAADLKTQQLVMGEIRPVNEQDHIRGASNAKITVVEYSDLECPFCKMFHPTMQQIVDEYPNDVRWVYRHFPIEQLHSKAAKEAEATECAAEQGKFWEFTDKIFEVTPSNDGLDPKELPELAKQVGVSDITQFTTCLESGKYQQHVQDDIADARSAGGRGTPYSLILVGNNKIPIPGAQPYEAVKQAIDRALTL